MFNNLGFGISKKSLINTTIKTLQAMEGKSPLQKITDQMSMTVMKDPEVGFVLRTFSKKYNLPMVDLCIEPVVQENTLAVKEWCLMVNREVAFTAEGCQDLIDVITAMVLERDPQEILKTVAILEGCLK